MELVRPQAGNKTTDHETHLNRNSKSDEGGALLQTQEWGWFAECEGSCRKECEGSFTIRKSVRDLAGQSVRDPGTKQSLVLLPTAWTSN